MSVGVGVGLDLPRPRGALVRDAQAHAGRRAGGGRAGRTGGRPTGGRGAGSCARSRRPASSRASCRQSRRRWRWPPGCATRRPRSGRAARRRRRRGDGGGASRRRSAASGGQLAASDPLGRVGRGALPRPRGRDGGRRGGGGGRARPGSREASATRCEASSRGLGELLLAAAARGRRADPRRARRLRRRSTAAQGLLEVVGDALARPRAAGAVRRPQSAARRAGRGARLRAAEGRFSGAGRGARGAARRRWPSCALTRICPERARRVGSARRSRRSEASSSPGAALVLERIDFRGLARGADLVVTGEGTVDRSSREGKAVGEVVRIVPGGGVRCELFGGRVDEAPPGVEVHALSGDPDRAADDLVELGERLAARCSAPRSTLRHRLEHLPGELGVLLDERPELPRRDAVALERRLGGDRRRPRTVVDERDLAEVVAVRRASFASSPSTLTAASPSSMMKNPIPDWPSLAIVSPASNCAPSSSSRAPGSFLSRSEKSGTCRMSSSGAAMARILRRRRPEALGLDGFDPAGELLDPALRRVELRRAEAIELLAALPERDRLVEARLAALEPLDDRLPARAGRPRSSARSPRFLHAGPEAAGAELDVDAVAGADLRSSSGRSRRRRGRSRSRARASRAARARGVVRPMLDRGPPALEQQQRRAPEVVAREVEAAPLAVESAGGRRVRGPSASGRVGRVSSARSGTTSRAAAVGVEARASATRSESGVSCS